MLQRKNQLRKTMTFVSTYQENFQNVLNNFQKSSSSLKNFRDFLCGFKAEDDEISFAEVVSCLEANQKKLLLDVFTKYCHGGIATVYRTEKLSRDTLYHPLVVWCAGLLSDLCVRYKKYVLEMDDGFNSEEVADEPRQTTYTNGTVLNNIVDFETIIVMIFDSMIFKKCDADQFFKPLVAKIVDSALLVCRIQEYFNDSDREDDDEISEQEDRQEHALSRLESDVYLLFDAMMKTKVVSSSQKQFIDKALDGRTLHPQTPLLDAPFSVVDQVDVENEKKRAIEEKMRKLKEEEKVRKRKRAEQQMEIAQKNLEKAKRDLSNAAEPQKKKKTLATKN